MQRAGGGFAVGAPAESFATTFTSRACWHPTIRGRHGAAHADTLLCVRFHLTIATLFLAAIVGAGVWYARGAGSGSNGPVALRNQVAQSEAVVVTYFANGPVAAPEQPGMSAAPQMTFVRGKGWVWQAPAGPGDTPAGVVVSSATGTRAAVAPGCYEGIPESIAPGPWEVPGVNLVRDLASAPHLKHNGTDYSYTVTDAAGHETTVTEDLAGIAQGKTYTARTTNPVTLDNGVDARTGVFTVRGATPDELQRALALIDGTRPSAGSAIELDSRMLGDAPAEGPFQTLYLVSLQDCPTSLATDYSKWRPAPPTTLELFRETPPGYFLNAPLHINADAVSLTHVVPVIGFLAPSEAALLASTQSTDEVRLAPGAMFAVLVHEPAPTVQNVALIYRVSRCESSAWFPCG